MTEEVAAVESTIKHKHVPQQTNGYDCGVYVLLYSSSICIFQEVRGFSPEHVTALRKQIVYEFIIGQLWTAKLSEDASMVQFMSL